MAVHTRAPVGATITQMTARWRHLLTPPASGAWNMAADDVLLDRARATGETVIRVYSWASPTLSLGRNQTAKGLYDLGLAAARGVEIVRRPTGGRAVLHHREITYSVTAPLGQSSLRESYDRINALLLRSLLSLGVRARLAMTAGRPPLPDGSPCFEVPTQGEIMVDGRKLVGSAQWRDDGALLQHGSILIDDDQSMIGELSLDPQPPYQPPATLREALGRAPSSAEMLEALVGAVTTAEDPDATNLALDQSLMEAIALREQHYRSPEWTWRR